MNIALLTIWHCKNYGAEMQAYATVKALRKLGHNVSIIDFRLDDKLNPSIRQKIINLVEFITPVNMKFLLFWRKYFNKTKYYRTIDELRDSPPVADVYLVGSDQVWNESITREKASVFFLDFGVDKIFRLSYASSIGTSQWMASNLLTEKVQVQLSKFKSVSCRERTGVKILKEKFGVTAQNVLDPTLLHKEYPELTGTLYEENTLVYYQLSEDNALANSARQLATVLNLSFCDINKKRKIPFTNSLVWNRASIQKWIRAIAQAGMVVTHSFHGLAFSLIYHRQFIIVQNSTNPERGSRLTDLLDVLGLQNRMFYNFDEVMNARPWENPIDYEVVDNKLDILRAESLSFLKDNLQ